MKTLILSTLLAFAPVAAHACDDGGYVITTSAGTVYADKIVSDGVELIVDGAMLLNLADVRIYTMDGELKFDRGQWVTVWYPQAN